MPLRSVFIDNNGYGRAPGKNSEAVQVTEGVVIVSKALTFTTATAIKSVCSSPAARSSLYLRDEPNGWKKDGRSN